MTVILPVYGEINSTRRSEIHQISVDDFEIAIAKLWDAGITGLLWVQYTPFFNDGDVCVFSARLQAFSLSTLPDEELTEPSWDYVEYDQDSDALWHEPPWKIGFTWNSDISKHEKIPDFVKPEWADVLREFQELIESGSVDTVLEENFGDHAQVVATPNCYSVIYYEHE